jgi:hypothetical protein
MTYTRRLFNAGFGAMSGDSTDIRVKYGTNYIGFGASWVITPSSGAPYADVIRSLQLK